MFQTINEQPESTRKTIVWIAVGVTMVFVVAIWVISLKQGALNAKNLSQEEQLGNGGETEEGTSLESILKDNQTQFEDLLQTGAKAENTEETEEPTSQLPDTNVKVIKPGDEEVPDEEATEENGGGSSATTTPSPAPSASSTVTPTPTTTPTPTR